MTHLQRVKRFGLIGTMCAIVGAGIGCFFVKHVPTYYPSLHAREISGWITVVKSGKEYSIPNTEDFIAEAMKKGYYTESPYDEPQESYIEWISIPQGAALLSLVPFTLALWFLFLHCLGQLLRTIRGEER